jgi:hypothetical protein
MPCCSLAVVQLKDKNITSFTVSAEDPDMKEIERKKNKRKKERKRAKNEDI